MSDHEDDDHTAGAEEDGDIYVEPIVQLTLVAIPTGEDDEDTVLELYVLIGSQTVDPFWVNGSR